MDEIFNSAEDAIQKGDFPEFAFIMLRTKIERFFFARVGYFLQKTGKFHVRLEVQANIVPEISHPKPRKRLDLVIYDSLWNPLAICEGKMYYTFNILEGPKNSSFQEHNHKDISDDIKLLQRCRRGFQKFYFLILGHYAGKELSDHFKYNKEHNRIAKNTTK